MALSVDNNGWRTMETIRLLEAYLATDRWSKRAAALQRLYGKVPKYSEEECKRRMDAIFAQPTPDTIPGVLNETHHSKKAVEAWLIHFQQKAEYEQKHAEQMRKADERLLIDLIERFRAGKITNEEIQARLEAQREIDRRLPNAEEYERKTMEQVRKHAHTAVDAMLKAKSAKEFLLKSNLIPGSRAADIPTPVVSPAKPEIAAKPLAEDKTEASAAVESTTEKAAHEEGPPASVRKTPSPQKTTLEQQRSPPPKAKQSSLLSRDETDVPAVASPQKNPAPAPQRTPLVSPQKARAPSPQKAPNVSPQQAPASPPRHQMKSPPRVDLAAEPQPEQIAVSEPSPNKSPSPKTAMMEQEESPPGSPFPEATVVVDMIEEELTPSLVNYSPSPEKSPEKESSDDGKRVLRERKVSPMKSPTSSLANTKQLPPATTTPERKTRSQAVKSPPPAPVATIPQSPSDLLSPELGKPPAPKATPRKTSIGATVSLPPEDAAEKKEEEKEESDADDVIVMETDQKPSAEEVPGPRMTRRSSKPTEEPPQAIATRRQSRRSTQEHPSGAPETDTEAYSEKDSKAEKVQVPMATRGQRRQSSRLNITYSGDPGASSAITSADVTMPTLRKRRPTGGSEVSTDISAPQTPHTSALAEIPESLDLKLEDSDALSESTDVATAESRKRARTRAQLQEKKPGKESPIPTARRSSRATSGASTPAREDELAHAKGSASVKQEVAAQVTSSAAQTRVSVRHDLKQKFAAVVATPVRARPKAGRGHTNTPEVGVQTGTVKLSEHDAVYYEESAGPLNVITVSMDDDSEAVDIPMPHQRCPVSNCGVTHRTPSLKEPANEETYEEQEEEEKEEAHSRPSSSVPTARRSRQRQEEPADDEPKAKRARKDAPRSSRASERLTSAAPSAAPKSRSNREPLVAVDIVKEHTTSAESSLQAKLQERKPTEKAVLMNIWRQISSASNSGHFATPVSEKDVPGYGAVIDHPVDLSTIRALIEDGKLCTLQQLKETFDLMFTNATVFNAPDHEVAVAANALWKDANVLIKELEGSSESESTSKRAVRARKAASRSEALTTVQFVPSMTSETTVKQEADEEGATRRVIFSRRATSKCATGDRRVVN